MGWSNRKPDGRVVSAMVAAVTVLLLVAGVAVAVRSGPGASAYAFIAGGRGSRAVDRAAPDARPGPLSDPVSLDAALAAAGTRVPPGAHVYAAKVGGGGGGLTFDDYVAGGGGLATDFWPASSIKVLAAVGALEFVGRMGFTGAATVSFGDASNSTTIKAIYDAALRQSSNADYDRLVEIAGVDWLNREFLTSARGFPATVIQRSYTVGGTLDSPTITLAEGGRLVVLPARPASAVARCPAGNCSDLFEMSESVRRVVLNDEVAPSERFAITRADVGGLTDALRGADGFFNPAVTKVLGAGATIYSKPGDVADRDCLDVTLIVSPSGRRFLLSATVPEEQGGCDTLVALATGVLQILTSL